MQDRRGIRSRRLEGLGGRFKARAGREPQRGEYLWRRRLHPGIDQNREYPWQRDQRTKSVADAGHHSRVRMKTDGNVRSGRPSRLLHPRIIDRQSGLVGEQPQGRRRIRGASAKPGRSRQSLDQPEPAEFLPDVRRERAGGSHNQIFVGRAGFHGPGADNLKNQIAARLEPDPVAQPRERHEALEIMITVGATPNYAQRQIDLRRRPQPAHWTRARDLNPRLASARRRWAARCRS